MSVNRRLASVWNWHTGGYDYYAVPSVIDADEEPKPPPLRERLRVPLGDPPDWLERRLPAGALYVGSGIRALGEIMIPRQVEL